MSLAIFPRFLEQIKFMSRGIGVPAVGWQCKDRFLVTASSLVTPNVAQGVTRHETRPPRGTTVWLNFPALPTSQRASVSAHEQWGSPQAILTP